MTKVLEAINPSTTTGAIIVGIIITLGSTGIIALLAWFLGPLRWPVQSRRLRKILISGRHFLFVFNPGANKMKMVTFLPDGQVGEGRNSNEHTWRIRRGKLEIFAFDGAIYSRFNYNHKTGRIEHTNDPDTRSVLGQYFEPQFKSWKQEIPTTS
jgi:hypothetical protein